MGINKGPRIEPWGTPQFKWAVNSCCWMRFNMYPPVWVSKPESSRSIHQVWLTGKPFNWVNTSLLMQVQIHTIDVSQPDVNVMHKLERFLIFSSSTVINEFVSSYCLFCPDKTWWNVLSGSAHELRCCQIYANNAFIIISNINKTNTSWSEWKEALSCHADIKISNPVQLHAERKVLPNILQTRCHHVSHWTSLWL